METGIPIPATSSPSPPPANEDDTGTFVLPVDMSQIDHIYNFQQSSNLFDSTPNTNTLDVTSLLNSETHNMYSYVDDNKQCHKIIVTMRSVKDHGLLPGWGESNESQKLDNETVYNCFWDKNPIRSIRTIGCPIAWIPDKKNEWTGTGTYITDGIFCSFNCAMAFIKDNLSNSMYRESTQLLHMLYRDMFSISVFSEMISPAPT